MNKKSLICTLGGALFLGALVHLGMSLKQNNAERDLFLANVEALTDGESGGWTFWCTTYTDEVFYEYYLWWTPCYGELACIEIVKACNNGFFSYCYPGYIRQHFDCSGSLYREVDNTYISGCL